MNLQGKNDGSPLNTSHNVTPSKHLESTFAPAPMSVPDARRFVLSAGWTGDEEANDRLALITSELVTNAVLHARTTVRVKVTVSTNHIRVDVIDGSTRPALVKTYDKTAPTGRGLHVVGALADRWGIDTTDEGKTVWFELDHTETQHEL